MPSFPFFPPPPRNQASAALSGSAPNVGFESVAPRGQTALPQGSPQVQAGNFHTPRPRAATSTGAIASTPGITTGFEAARGQSTAASGGFFSTNGIGIVQGGTRGAIITGAALAAGATRAAVLDALNESKKYPDPGGGSSTGQMIRGWRNSAEAQAKAKQANESFSQLQVYRQLTNDGQLGAVSEEEAKNNKFFEKKGLTKRPAGSVALFLSPVDKDLGLKEIHIQFSPDSFSHSMGSTWVEANAMTRNHPILQWNRGNQESFKFEAAFFSPSAIYPDVSNMWGMFLRLVNGAKPQERLGRPPIWELYWGSLAFGQVVIAEIGEVQYNLMQQNQEGDQYPRSIKVPLALKKYVKFDFETTERNPSRRDTLYVTAKIGEHWEHIAKRVYRDPDHGDTLRKMYPGAPVPVPGTIYKLPDMDKIGDPEMSPESVPLAWDDEAISMRTSLFEKRGRPYYSAIVMP